jgi:FlaA1/EpsC-like NDP-sugar epimerase
MRFELTVSSIPEEYIEKYEQFMVPFTLITLVVFWFCRIYHSLWEYASITELYKVVEACTIAEVIHVVVTTFLGLMLPRSTYFNTWVYMVIGTSASRFMYRFIRTGLNRYRTQEEDVRIMIIGAGNAANVLIREIAISHYLANSRVVCVIDDSPSKVGKYIHGIKIVGTREDIKEMAEQYDVDEIIFAIPSASVENRKQILSICKETDCELKILPGVYQMVDGEINIKDIRRVDVLDLLGRNPVDVDIESIMGYVKDKVVLVTGGGGSIGSELCRQLVSHKPRKLIIFDIYENNAYDIQQELVRDHKDANVETLIGSVRNVGRLESVFEKYHPDIIYHAAAHKHVPLMEESPNEAVKNNVIGTYNVAMMADRYGAEKFVMISTDKAVNPTNVMGATKRICEMIVQSFNEKSRTEYVAVRFGNVLGSNGSVIPLFKKQIEAGGPVTVTDPNIIRYFMTIPEAVSLVLQAGAYAKGGEIFVLDMGEPVKIDDLAKNLIRLSGYTLGVDMDIEYTGLRPGEKLYEELLMDEEGLQDTANKLIHIGKPIDFDKENFARNLQRLEEGAYSENCDIRALIKEIVPTYQPRK